MNGYYSGYYSGYYIAHLFRSEVLVSYVMAKVSLMVLLCH